MNKRISIFIASLIAILNFGIAEAQLIPTSTPGPNAGIPQVYAYSGVLAPSTTMTDLLVIANYYLPLPTPTTQPQIGDSFIAQLLAADNTTVLSTTLPISTPYFNGYNYGTIGFYLTAAQVTSAAITYNSSLYVKILGSPILFTGTIPIFSGSAQWHPNSTQPSLTSTFISQDIIAEAQRLSTSWQTQLLSNNTVLNSTGAAYFASAIPNIQKAGTSVFPNSVTSGTFTNPVPKNTNFTSISTFLTVIGVKPAIKNISGLLCGFTAGVPKCGDIAGDLVLIFATLAVSGYFITITDRHWIGYLVMAIMFPIIGLTGLVGSVFIGVTAIGAVLMLWWFFYGKRG